MDEPDDLRVGLLAVRRGRVAPDAFVTALHDWARREGWSLGRVLIERGELTREEWVGLRAAATHTPRVVSKVEPTVPFGTTVPVEIEASVQADAVGSLHFEAGEPVAIGADAAETATFPYREVGGSGGAQPGAKSGTSSSGRFRPLRLHARGGLGEVFVALDKELNREVALKEIRDGLVNETASRSRFSIEAEITGNLEHPGIVPVYSLGEHPDGRPYYAMRFIQGKTLHQAVAEYRGTVRGDVHLGRRLELRALIRHFVAVCQTLEYAHSRGIVHRDIKPSNVMLGRFGETLVVDWGLAKPVGRAEPPPSSSPGAEAPIVPSGSGSRIETQAGTTVGTPGFMSPEQAAGELDRLGPVSDIYSLGAMLYFVLAGRAPIEESDIVAAIRKTRRGDFAAPRSWDRSIPRPLDAVCMKALATDPRDRYPSARAFAEDLERWLGDEPVSAWGEPWWARVSRWGRRHRGTVTIGGLALVLVSVVSMVAAGLIQSTLTQEKALSAELMFDRSIEAFHALNCGRGLVQLAQSLGPTPARAGVLRTVIRENLGAWQASMAELRDILPFEGRVDYASFGPGGKTVLAVCAVERTGASDGAAVHVEGQLWDLKQRKLIGGPFPHGPSPALAAIRADGKVVVLAGEDGVANLWDVRTGDRIGAPIHHPSAIHDVAFAPDGETVATAGTDGYVRFWDTTTGKAREGALRHPGDVHALAYAPDGVRLVTGDEHGAARLWDLAAGGEPEVIAQHTGPIWAVAFSPQGDLAASAGNDGTIRLWSVDSDRPTARLPVLSGLGVIVSLSFSSDGKMVLSGGEDNNARAWLLEDGSERFWPIEHLGTVNSVGLSPDGESLLTVSGEGLARLWSPPEPRSQVVTKWDGELAAYTVSSDDQAVLLMGANGRARVFDRATGLSVDAPRNHNGPILAGAFAPMGRRVVTVGEDGQALLWDGQSGRALGGPFTHGAPVRHVAFLAGGESFLTGCDDGTVRLWSSTHEGPPRVLFRHVWPVRALTVSRDGLRVASSARDRARVWLTRTGEELVAPILHTGTVTALGFSPDGTKLAVSGEDKATRIWDLASGRSEGMPLRHEGSVNSVMFSPDGEHLLTASNDATARRWHVASLKPVGPPMTHGGPVLSARFLSDRAHVLTGGAEGTIRVWRLPSLIPDEPHEIVERIQIVSGLRLETANSPFGEVRALDAREWAEVRSGREAP